MADTYDIIIEQGTSWDEVLTWFDVPIGGQISNTVANPTVVTTTVAHGLANGDKVDIEGSNSMPSIEGEHTVTVISGTTFSIPVNVTAAGNAGKLRKAINLSGYTARMKVKDAAGATVMSLTEADGITLGVQGAITLRRTAAQTAAFTWSRGKYDLELAAAADPPGTKRIVQGDVIVSQEKTT